MSVTIKYSTHATHVLYLHIMSQKYMYILINKKRLQKERVSVFTGLDYWNGIVEWNTGMENHAQNVVIRDMHACALVVHT